MKPIFSFPIACALRWPRWSAATRMRLPSPPAPPAAWLPSPRRSPLKRMAASLAPGTTIIDNTAQEPEVLDMIRRCNIRNYSIYLKDDFLFGYFEYNGTDYAADMARMAADPKTQEWWAIMMPLQKPLDSRREGEWWAEMEEVFHLD